MKTIDRDYSLRGLKAREREAKKKREREREMKRERDKTPEVKGAYFYICMYNTYRIFACL